MIYGPFNFEKHKEINIERTENSLKGLFKHLKHQLNNHNRLVKSRNIMFIKDFLNKRVANIKKINISNNFSSYAFAPVLEHSNLRFSF